MPIKLICRCGRNLIVPEERAGRLIACPKCQHKMLVPGERKAVGEPVPLLREALTPVSATATPEPEVAPRREPKPSRLRSHSAPPPLKPAAPATPPAIAAKVVAPPPLSVVEKSTNNKVQPPQLTPAATPVKPTPTPPPTPAPVVVAPAAVAKQPPPVPQPALQPIAQEENKRIFGYQHDSDKLSAAYVLATLIVLLGLFSMLPAALDIVRFLRQPEGDPVGRFAYVLLFLGLIQFAYAIYLAQLPDWGASWVLTAVVLLQAALYMAILTTIQLAQGQSPLVQWLDLHAHVDNGRVRAWCFVMLLLSGVAAYFCGSVSIRWRRAFQLVRTAYGR